MASATYVIEKLSGTDFEKVDTRKSKTSAEKVAEETRSSEGVSTRVVNESDGTVVSAFPQRAKPFTRVEPVELPKGVKVPRGYTVAYQRKRIHTLVLRANDRSGYLLMDTATGATMPADGTVDARLKTNKLRSGELKFAS